jgi:hypothetical protein
MRVLRNAAVASFGLLQSKLSLPARSVCLALEKDHAHG